MKMAMVPDGLAVGADAARALQPVGDHVMISGVTGKYHNGDVINVTLTFEKAGAIVLRVLVDNARRTPPGMGPTEFDAMSAGVAGVPDAALVAALGEGVTVAPVHVMGNDAVVGWQQGGTARRALLRRVDGQWQAVLQAGADLRVPAFLAAQGVTDAVMLSQMFNMAEDALGADHVTKASSFQGVVMEPEAAHN